MTGLIIAGEGQNDVKNINELFIERKDQINLNRFITESKWDVQTLGFGEYRFREIIQAPSLSCLCSPQHVEAAASPVFADWVSFLVRGCC